MRPLLAVGAAVYCVTACSGSTLAVAPSDPTPKVLAVDSPNRAFLGTGSAVGASPAGDEGTSEWTTERPDDDEDVSLFSLSLVPLAFPALGLGGMLELGLFRWETFQASALRFAWGWAYEGLGDRWEPLRASFAFMGIFGVGAKTAIGAPEDPEFGVLAYPLGAVAQGFGGGGGGVVSFGLIPVDLHVRLFFDRWHIQGGAIVPLWWTYGGLGYESFPPVMFYLGGGY